MLIKYLASAIIVVKSNSCVGLHQELKYLFFLLSACYDELLSTPKILTFLSMEIWNYKLN